MRRISAQELERQKQLEAKATEIEKAEHVRTKRLGPEKFVTPEVEVALSDEIPQSMRRLKSRSDLLADRLSSLQKRNIIEPRTLKDYNRRYALKVKEKRIYREYEREQATRYKDL